MPALDNPRHERFAQLVATGQISQSEAYRQCYDAEPNGNADRLTHFDPVEARIAEIRAEKTPLRVLSLAEKRDFLHKVVKTPIGDIDETSILAQKVKYSTRTSKDGDVFTEKEVESPNKLKAIELDAKLAGELDGSSSGAAVMVNVNLLGMSLDSGSTGS